MCGWPHALGDSPRSAPGSRTMIAEETCVRSSTCTCRISRLIGDSGISSRRNRTFLPAFAKRNLRASLCPILGSPIFCDKQKARHGRSAPLVDLNWRTEETFSTTKIGELPLDTQVALLRCLQNVNSNASRHATVKIDVRVIVATIASGSRRCKRDIPPDLYYRLTYSRSRFSPLRERQETF